MTNLFRPEVHEHRSQRLYGRVILTQPFSTQLMITALTATCGGLAAFIVLGHYSRTETANGTLVTETPSAKIFPPASGVVSSLHAQEGVRVRKGDLLATLQVDRSAEGAADGAAASGIDAVEARIAIAKRQAGLVDQKRLDERRRLASAIRSTSAQISSLETQLSVQQEVVRSTRSLYEQIQPVVERGFVSRFQGEQRRETWLTAQQGLAGLQQQLAAQQGQLEQSRTQVEALETDRARQLSDVDENVQALAQQRSQLLSQRSVTIRAPISGVATAIETNAGSAVVPGTPMLSIIPDRTTLKAEVYAPSRAIGFVHEGQIVRLAYDSFPQQRFGMFQGRIVSVSRSVVDPREGGLPAKIDEPSYKITIRLQKQSVDAFGKPAPLQAGTVVKATIVLDRRNFLQWLLSPLRAAAQRSS